MGTNKQHKYTKNISNWSQKPKKQHKKNQIKLVPCLFFLLLSIMNKTKNDLRSGMCMCTVYVLECMCLMRMVQMCFLMIISASIYQLIRKLAKCFSHHSVVWMYFARFKNSEIHLFYLCAYFGPNRLEWWPMHAFVADDFHYHIVCNDLEPNPKEKLQMNQTG